MPSVAERHTTPSPTQSVRPKRRPVCVDAWSTARRREYNMHQPLMRLCPDVLELIFLFGAMNEAENANNIRAMRRAVTHYSQTCRQWRAVALSVKFLWAMLVDFERRSLLWNTEMLRRSHPLPLSQQISFTPRPAHHRLTETAPLRRKLGIQLDYFDRMKHFSVACPDVLWDFLVARLCSASAPHLETLQVAYHPSPVLQGHTLPVRLPSSLFGGHAPRLRKLALTECIVNFGAPIFRKITHLHVVDLSLADAPTAKEWLVHLALMPDLQSLTLEGAIASEWDRPSSTSSSMQSVSSHHQAEEDEDKEGSEAEASGLPIITDMMLDADVEDISTLLEALPMPSPCRWSVLCANARPGRAVNAVLAAYNRGMAACYPLSDSLPPKSPPPSPCTDEDVESSGICPLAFAANSTDIYIVSQRRHPTDPKKSVILYADLHCTGAGGAGVTALFPEVVAGLSRPVSEYTSASPAVDMGMGMGMSSGVGSRPQTPSAILSASTSAILRATSLEANLPPEVLALPAFYELMCAARRVHTLVRLSGSMTRNLLPVISPDNDDADMQPQTIPLPALTHIVFVDDDSMWRGAYDVFLSFVAARSRVGAPLRDVYFLDCCVLEDRVRELKEAGIEVEGGVGAKRWWNL